MKTIIFLIVVLNGSLVTLADDFPATTCGNMLSKYNKCFTDGKCPGTKY